MNANSDVSHLNRLIEVCLDGELGYRTAARHLHSSKLRTILTNYAIKRSQFANDLRGEVERQGGSPTDAGSVAASLHRGWIALKSAVSGGDAGAILGACEAGEHAAMASYDAAVNGDLPARTRSLVEKQRHAIEEAHRRIRQIKDEIASGVVYPVND